MLNLIILISTSIIQGCSHIILPLAQIILMGFKRIISIFKLQIWKIYLLKLLETLKTTVISKV